MSKAWHNHKEEFEKKKSLFSKTPREVFFFQDNLFGEEEKRRRLREFLHFQHLEQSRCSQAQHSLNLEGAQFCSDGITEARTKHRHQNCKKIIIKKKAPGPEQNCSMNPKFLMVFRSCALKRLTKAGRMGAPADKSVMRHKWKLHCAGARLVLSF